jgi:hypothetical protein
MPELEGIPGGERVARGLADLGRGDLTVDALLVLIASGRLAQLGLSVPPRPELPKDAEILLYEKLQARSDDPYGAYRAALAELDSFVSSYLAARGEGFLPD